MKEPVEYSELIRHLIKSVAPNEEPEQAINRKIIEYKLNEGEHSEGKQQAIFDAALNLLIEPSKQATRDISQILNSEDADLLDLANYLNIRKISALTLLEIIGLERTKEAGKIESDIVKIQKQTLSLNGKKGSDITNQDHRNLKEAALAYWHANIDKNLSGTKAALLLGKQVSVSQRKLAQYVNDEKRRLGLPLR